MIDLIGRIKRILTQADKWPGAEVDTFASGLNLNAGVATSGKAGADVFTIPAAGRIEILCAIVSMRNATIGANITVRAYTNVNGVEDEIFNSAASGIALVQGTNPDGFMVINGNYGANEPIRFEMYSDNVADINVDVPYKAIWRPME